MKRDFFKYAFLSLTVISLVLTSCSKDDGDTIVTGWPEGVVVLSGNTGTQTLTSDKTYVLDGFVTVDDGEVLTIEPGTMIWGAPGQKENASALIVQKGGKLIAEGTASEPIIFTGAYDEIDGSVYGRYVNGLWGGVIMLGKAPTNNTDAKQIEGVPDATEAKYGVAAGETPVPADNSGSLAYVSIRHGGTDIGDGNEINGLTLGAVGSGTSFNYIEISSNKDDGIEFFGGVPQLKHILVAYCGDDSYDYDEGFSGKGQFWIALQAGAAGDRCAEQDGGPSNNEEGEPYAIPTIANATYISNGGSLMIFRDNAGGNYHNSVFANAGDGVRIEYRNDKNNAYDQLMEGNLTINNCIFSEVAGNDTSEIIFVKPETDKGPEPATADQDAIDHWLTHGNTVQDLGIGAELDDDDKVVGWNIAPASGANAGVAVAGDSFFDQVTYQGAIEPGATSWVGDWTFTMTDL